MAHALQRLVVGDDPNAWRAAGFTVHGNELRFGKVTIELAGASGKRGALGWRLDAVTSDIESIPTVAERTNPGPALAPATATEHVNSVFAIDHVVVETGDVVRTVAAFAQVGMVERRTGQIQTPIGERRQSFLWAGRVIIEVVGPIEPDQTAPMGIWGLALVTSNLETTTHVLAENLTEPRDAVQPGRKIATVNTKALDISIPMVILSPHVAELL